MAAIGIISNSENSVTFNILARYGQSAAVTDLDVRIVNNNEFDGIDIFIYEEPVTNANLHKIPEGSVIIINSDDKAMTQSIINCNLCVLNCGFSYKDTITASSVEDGICTFCLQRNIKTVNDISLAPQEFVVKTGSDLDIYCVLSCIGALLISGEKPCDIQKFLF